MKTGALIFAQNNGNIDYAKLAAWSTENIHRHLGLPVCVITDHPHECLANVDHLIVAKDFSNNTRFFADIGSVVPWYNSQRTDAFALSPWDRTLLLDADYVIASDTLLSLTESSVDMLCHDRAFDITGLNDFRHLNKFGKFSTPMLWATVMVFNKTRSVEMIFDMMNMIKNNWQHYKHIHGIGRSPYRNDFALSIAANTLNGHWPYYDAIPWPLPSVSVEPSLSFVSKDTYSLEWSMPDSKRRRIEIHRQDFHAMNKKTLEAMIENQS